MTYILLAAITFLAPLLSHAAPIDLNGLTGTIYKQDSDLKETLFKYKYKVHSTKEGEVQESFYYNPDGSLAASQRLLLDKNGKMLNYKVRQEGANETGYVVPKDKRVL